MCLDREMPGAAGIVEKALSSIDPSQGKTPRDRRLRKKKREKLLRDTTTEPLMPTQGMLPSFVSNWIAGSRTSTRISAKALDSVIRKWVRGIHYHECGRLIPSDESIEVLHVYEWVAADALKEAKPHIKHIRRGPGVTISLLTVVEDGEAESIYSFEIWEQFRAYAAVRAESIDSELEAGPLSRAAVK